MSCANIVATITAESTTFPELSCKDIYQSLLPLTHILELAAEVWSMSVILDVDELTMLCCPTCYLPLYCQLIPSTFLISLIYSVIQRSKKTTLSLNL
jgi:hypothetical protein